MGIWADLAFDTLVGLWPMALAFGLLALAVKRRTILNAVRASHRETLTNIGLVALNSVFLAPFLLFPGDWLGAQLGLFSQWEVFWDALPAVATGAAAFLLVEFTIYWRHRFEHTKMWWPIHAVHHSDETITWLTLLRKHPFAKALSGVVDHLPLVLAGFPLWAIALAVAIRGWWGFFIHADVPWTLGPLGKVMMSPAAHRLHHIDDLELCGANYGNTITLWDRMFGTYTDPRPYLNCKTGVCGGSRGLVGELARPFVRERKAFAGTDQPAIKSLA